MRKIIAALALMSVLFVVNAASAAVNINTAGADQLAELKGIGPVTADKIVTDRKANGRYKSVDELTRVKGIGPKTVDDLRDDASTGQRSEKASSD